nr:uncharacterized protein LOC111417053 [Onthophagus taurus]
MEITQLKIASNPFAKGFRDCDPDDSEVALSQSSQQGKPRSPTRTPSNGAKDEDRPPLTNTQDLHNLAVQTLTQGMQHASATFYPTDYNPMYHSRNVKHNFNTVYNKEKGIRSGKTIRNQQNGTNFRRGEDEDVHSQVNSAQQELHNLVVQNHPSYQSMTIPSSPLIPPMMLEPSNLGQIQGHHHHHHPDYYNSMYTRTTLRHNYSKNSVYAGSYHEFYSAATGNNARSAASLYANSQNYEHTPR